MKVKLDARFEVEGNQILIVEVAKIDKVIKLKSIGYGYEAGVEGMAKVQEIGEGFTSDRRRREEEGVCKFPKH